MKLISRLSSCINLPPAMLLLLAVLLSKFYFLWGFQMHTHLPSAPIPVVLIRDVILLAFFGYLTLKIQWRKIALDKLSKFIVGFFIIGLAIAVFHLFSAKNLHEIAQHYFRNLLIPSLSFPLFYWYLETNPIVKEKVADQLHSLLIVFGVISLFFGYAQIFFWPSLMWETRPTGILGDPLINSCFLLIMLWGLFKTENSALTKVIMIGLTGFVLFSGSSISAIAAFLIAVFFTTIKSARYSKTSDLFTKRNFIGFLLLTCLVVILFSSLHRQLKLSNGMDEKIQNFWHSISCNDECEPDPSIRGRIASYKFTYNLCQQDPKSCILGAYQSGHYYRLDSTLASIIANCGVIFASMYIYIFLVLPIFLVKRATLMKYNLDLLFGIYVLYWAFGLFNTSIYKYPLNIIFYTSLAAMISLSRSDSKNS